jgi:broad specificity phosphatase PhoE
MSKLDTKRDATTLYLVHHASTPLDEEGRVHGWGQASLSAKGKKDATASAEYLASKGVGETYSSDLNRGIETANIIRTKLGIEKPNTEREGLRPMDVGTLAGEKDEDIEGIMSDLKSRLWAHAPGSSQSVAKFLAVWGQELDRSIQEALGEDHACVYVVHSHNMATLPYLLSTGVAPIRLRSPVGPGGVVALHVSDGGGQVILDHQFDPNPVEIDGQ